MHTVSEKQSVAAEARIQSHNARTAALDPCLDGKILKLKIRGVSHIHRLQVAAQRESLSNFARAISCAIKQRAVICAGKIHGAALALPPTYQARGWRDARLRGDRHSRHQHYNGQKNEGEAKTCRSSIVRFHRSPVVSMAQASHRWCTVHLVHRFCQS